MSGNSFGTVFRVTTFGESHGRGLGVVIDGCPAGLRIDEAFIQSELNRRRVGQSKVTSQRQEPDKIEILSGVFEGVSTGVPIAMLIRNQDADSSQYDNLRETFRPGHADSTYFAKYGIRDHRGGGRSSGRETAARVAAGAVAKLLLSQASMKVVGWTHAVGDIEGETVDFGVIEQNIIRAADPKAAVKMEELILNARKDGESVGGIVRIKALNVPAGLGEPAFDKLDADIGKALFSIGSVKGVEIGAGFRAARMKGSESNDTVSPETGKYLSNNAGGILGGISSGQDIEVSIAVKPTPSICREQTTTNIHGEVVPLVIAGRHDPCICPRIVPVAEAMVALVLADHYLRNRASQL